MNKKFLALLSAGALTATLLAGCGSGGNTDPSTAEPSGEEGATLTTIESGKLIMSTNAQFPPYELVSDGEGAMKAPATRALMWRSPMRWPRSWAWNW